jgi:hypothetical protein
VNNGASNDELTPEQRAQFEQAIAAEHHAAVQRTLLLATAILSSKTTDKLDQNALYQLTDRVLRALPELAQAIGDVVDDDARAKNPYWGFRLLDASGNALGVTSVPKHIDDAKDAAEIIQALSTLAFIVTPAVHVVASILGLRVEIVQSATPPPRHSKIIV